mgnify:CR=1 FL=1
MCNTKILICLLFKNSSIWLSRFMGCLENLIRTKPENITYYLSVIYGNSTDNTDTEVKRQMNVLLDKYGNSHNLKLKMSNFSLPKRLHTIEKLAILRNACVDQCIDKEYDYVIQIDTDVIFTPLSVMKLIKTIKNNEDIWENKLNVGIIAPFVLIEDSNNLFYDSWAYRRKAGEKVQMFSPSRPYVPIEIDFKNPEKNVEIMNKTMDETINKGIFEVESVGTMYICRANIFSKFGVKYRTEERSEEERKKVYYNKKYESEQVVFCRDVKEKTEYRIYTDADIIVNHINLEAIGLMWH